MYTEVGFSYRYQVYHRISQSLPFGGKCQPDTEWEEDSCTLRFLNELILTKLNCTTPWLLSNARSYQPKATICKPDASQQAAEIYGTNRYPAHRVCPRSCKKMKISTVYLA